MAIASAHDQSGTDRTAARGRALSGTALRYLVAAGASYYGDWLTTVALVVLLFRLTGSATAPAIYIVARVAPRIFGPAPGGAIADRFGPARVVVVCALAQGALTAGIVGLAAVRAVWPIYVLVALAQFTGAMSQPAYNAVIPYIVTPQSLARVNAAYNAILESCLLVSPAIGAILLAAGITPQTLIIGDAASFLLAAVLMGTLRTPGHEGNASSRHGGMFAGINVVRRDAVLRIFAYGHLFNAFVITALQAVLVVAAAQRFGRDTDVGWLYAAVGGGGLLGGLALLRWPSRSVRSSGMAVAVVGELIPLGLFAFANSLALGCALLFVSSLFAVLYQTRGAIGLQQRVPKELLGRVNAVVRSALYFGMLLGAVTAAVAITWISWDRLVLLVAGVAAVGILFAVVTRPSEPDVLTGSTPLIGRWRRSRVTVGSAARLNVRPDTRPRA